MIFISDWQTDGNAKRKPNKQRKGEVEVKDADGANVKKNNTFSDIVMFQSCTPT